MNLTDNGFTLETVNGNIINPCNPDSNAIDIHDIAWALSRMPRFAGHTITEIPYTVAQHSIYVSEILENLFKQTFVEDEELALAIFRFNQENESGRKYLLIKALIHDAHEGYTGDLPSPIKQIPELRPILKEVEARLDVAIYAKLNLKECTETEKYLIKYCDNISQAIESYQYMPSRGLKWNLPKPSLVMLQQFSPPMKPLDSYQSFINRFKYLSDL